MDLSLTNYEDARRLAEKILLKEYSSTKPPIEYTDGEPYDLNASEVDILDAEIIE